MAGTINRDDVAAVRERAPLEDIIGQHVTLKSAGVGTLKGLCPFHDEKSPSFHVRPAAGRWHCFGCGEGGDVIEFVMKIDGMPFVEAVDYLAERAGVTLRYEAGGGPRREGGGGQRKRLMEVNRIAHEFYVAQMLTPEAKIARDFLLERGFGREVSEDFGLGYAPQGWGSLLDHLRAKNVTEDEARASGLFSEGQRGLYDRFRGRLLWPIRDVTGEVIGFGARRLYPDDEGPKYLNTPETILYKKSNVLYGLDRAKREIAQKRQVVVVEGYTDVMACHLAGVTTAVATCGTAFGEDHAKLVRRLMGDVGDAQTRKVGVSSPEVVFTFDGDEAGQNAALKSFSLDQTFLAQTYVAVDPDGMDPCDIRQQRGDEAVAALVAGRKPLFEFVLNTILAGHDLETAEGRSRALRETAPVVAGIRDEILAGEYQRRLAHQLGLPAADVAAAVVAAGGKDGKRTARPSSASTRAAGGAGRRESGGGNFGGSSFSGGYGGGNGGAGGGRDSRPAVAERAPQVQDPVARAEALALGAMLQLPGAIAADPEARVIVDELESSAFVVPRYRAIFDAIRAAGGPLSAGPSWVHDVVAEVDETLGPLVNRLAITTLPYDKASDFPRYTRSLLAAVLRMDVTRRIGDLRSRASRADGTAEADVLFTQVLELEQRKRELAETD